MAKRFLLSIIHILIGLIVFAQPKQLIKYKDFVFSEVLIDKNLSYSTDIPEGRKPKYYLFDLYQPSTDNSLKRPLIIWMHGGGFKYGSKKAMGVPLWSKSFARRGYVCAAINYRLSQKKPLRKFIDLAEGCYDAMQDVKKAVAYFKQHHTQFRIDTTRIILAGHSAGAMVALHSVYSSDAEMLKLIGSSDLREKPTTYNPLGIAAIINFWGAIFNTYWLKNENVPIVSVHGKKDRVVPYTQHDSPLHGSYLIHKKADSLHIPNKLKTYDTYAHELQKHFKPFLITKATKRRWLEAGQFAAEFLWHELLK